jgi:arginase family enzyme
VIDPLVDYGDAPVLPADAARSHAAIEATVGEVLEAGKVDPERYVQIGLRGYWPGEAEFAWQTERGITAESSPRS